MQGPNNIVKDTMKTPLAAVLVIGTALFPPMSWAESFVYLQPALNQPNLVQNGSFELITVVPGVETRARPWFGNLSYNENWDNAPDGHDYAQIGYAYQDVSVVADSTYSLTFWAAADLYVSPSATIDVQWGNENAGLFVTEPHSYNSGINRYEQIVWQQFTVPSLMANSSLERLEFQAIDGSQLLLDDVRLNLVPEPSSVAMFGVGFVLVCLRRCVKKCSTRS